MARGLPFQIGVLNPGSTDEFQGVAMLSSESVCKRLCSWTVLRKDSRFSKILKGTCDSSEYLRSNPSNWQKRHRLKFSPSPELCILADLSSEITETGCALCKFKVKSSFLQLLSKAVMTAPIGFPYSLWGRRWGGGGQRGQSSTSVLLTFLIGLFLFQDPEIIMEQVTAQTLLTCGQSSPGKKG